MAYTNIDDPSAHFQATTYTGAGANTVVTNGGNSDLKPDLLWIKNRTAGYAHFVVDSNRNISYAQNSSNAPYFETDSTAAENNNQNWMQSVNTDGFTTGISEHTNSNSGSAFVAWQWKANGGTTTAFNESGSNPGGTRQTNTDAGFSIISYTGTGSNGTIAHGLPSTPEFLIFKRRDATQFWCVWHQAIGDDNKLALHLSDGLDADGAFMNSTLPTSTNITVGGASVNTNADNGTYVCYAFSPIQGYSKFGKYVGNGSQDGPFVYTGFKPAFVIMKRSSGAGAWHLFDNKRSGYNYANDVLQADATAAELSGQTYQFVDFLSNGFKNRRATHGPNVSGETYIYMAFAENPFVTSTGVPTTAR
jgi:hypothetical protein